MSVESELLIKSGEATIEDLEQLHNIGYVFICEDGRITQIEFLGARA